MLLLLCVKKKAGICRSQPACTARKRSAFSGWIGSIDASCFLQRNFSILERGDEPLDRRRIHQQRAVSPSVPNHIYLFFKEKF
jgi:hypothetical protein